MQNEKSQSINKRFFEAYDALLALGKIKSKNAFCVDHDIDRRNFDRLREDPGREFQMSWLTALVVEYNVSADWILTGRGKLF